MIYSADSVGYLTRGHSCLSHLYHQVHLYLGIPVQFINLFPTSVAHCYKETSTETNHPQHTNCHCCAPPVETKASNQQ